MRSFIYASVGLIYSLFLTLNGLNGTGMGHGTGTGVFMALAFMPFPLVFWPAIAILLTRDHSKSVKRLIIYMLVLHYLGLAIYLSTLKGTDFKDFLIVWNHNPSTWMFNLMIYLAGQGFIWWSLLFKWNQKKRPPYA